MAGDDSWIRAEMGGTSRASVIAKPEVIVALIKRMKRPLFIVGHEVSRGDPDAKQLIDFIARVAGIRHIPVIGTSSTVKELINQGIRVTTIMGGMEAADRLRDPEWKGLDNQGLYDLVMFAALPYSFCWTILSGLKNSAPNLKTINIERRYQPHATWSFGNIALEPWSVQLQTVATLLEEEKDV